jgi:hypothetical protein
MSYRLLVMRKQGRAAQLAVSGMKPWSDNQLGVYAAAIQSQNVIKSIHVAVLWLNCSGKQGKTSYYDLI